MSNINHFVLRYVAKRLPLRRHGNDQGSNFKQLLQCFRNGWRERTKISLHHRFKIKSYKKWVNQFYDIVESIKNADFYSIIIVGISDASNKEQAVFRVSWVDGNLFTHEEFLGLHEMKKTDAISIPNLIKDIVLRLGFDSKKNAEPLIWQLCSNDGDK